MKLKNILEKNVLMKFLCFCFVGGTSALIHMLVFNVFFKVFGFYLNSNIVFLGASMNYILSFIMGVMISIVYNFSMNRNITFYAKNTSLKKQIPKFLVVYGLSIGVNFIIGIIVLNMFGIENILNANIAAFSGILASIPVSFFGSLLWTFKKSN